ncbi:tigger transposable element-derived protein 6-like [Harmonia axyridis]|uniref:tigger transposable element-derived protein 6-like n=1 Tax=Harmonia axyridis TaxID=115357 RepID=UPI001E2762CE|nr:tigger transposable element-derived protein 6-like [Harmonia axyridis]
MAPRKRFLTLKEKMELINIAEKENSSVRKLAERFNIGKTQAAAIVKQKDRIRDMWQSGDSLQQKLCRLKNIPEKIDRDCLDWFSRVRNQNIPVSGPLIKAKAKEIASMLNYDKFSASNVWLQKWRTRHNISFKAISGESADVNVENVNEFLQNLPSLLLGYKPEDIFNADESGLYFRALPDKTMALKKEKCVGGKMSKERLTILFCANMTGQKEKLLVIGKAACPRALKNVSIKDLPVTWKSNSKAWMTGVIMKEWLIDMDRRMRFQKRKILLFLDNAGSHPKDVNLTNIKLCFLPPNCTSVCQPLDQGIIKNVKFFYRDLILKHVLSKMDSASSASELSKSINILEALYFIKTAWDNVAQRTIQNCFTKAGFKKNGPSSNLSEEAYDEEDCVPLSVLATFFKNCKAVCNTVDDREFIDLDEEITTEEHSDFVDKNGEKDDEDRIEQESNIEGCIISESTKIKTNSEALKLIGELKIFAQEDFVAFRLVKNLETHFQTRLLSEREKKMTQSKITYFF